MRIHLWGKGLVLSLLAAVALIAVGCGQTENKGAQAKHKGGPAAKPGDHSGWWCDEHGVPEEVCSICSAKAAAEFKKKGDWCEKHDRALSQCFICNPQAQEKYTALYRAKLGKEPPEATDNKPPKEGDKQ
jgi:hypothetical protein